MALDPFPLWAKLVKICVAFIFNLFILIVNILDWTKKTPLNETDLLICSSTVFSLLHEILKMVTFLSNLNSFHYSESFLGPFYKVLESSNLWICAWLSVSFSFKIVNFNQRFYIYLQRRFREVLPWLLLLSVVSSFLMQVHPLWQIFQNLHFNSSINTKKQNPVLSSLVSEYLFFAMYYASFMLFFFSLSSTITYLCRHVRQMHNGETSPSLTAHVRAVQSLTGLLLLYTLYFSAIIAWTLFDVVYTFFTCVVSLRSILMPVLLVRANRKLSERLEQYYTSVLSACGYKQ